MNIINDFGPIYSETDLSQFPIEPFNTFSNLLFLFVIIYWLKKLPLISDKRFKNFLNLSLPILFIGFVGGTIYHATRSHNIWLILDFGPIYVLSILTSVYMWKKLRVNFLKIAIYIISLFIIPKLLFQELFENSTYEITMGYILIAVTILLPIILYEVKNRWSGKKEIIKALVCLVIAISFRIFDSSQFVQSHVSIGTHWLWHSFGAATTHLLLIYLSRNTNKLD